VANAAFALAQIVAGLKDESGRVTIPGFYDDVLPLGAEERRAFAELPFDDSQFCAGLGAAELSGETGYTTLERLWARPTLDVNGLLSGFTDIGTKTVMPSVAMAKVSMRLVPAQDPGRIADLFEAHLARATPTAVTLRVTRMYGGRPWRTSVDNPYIQAAWRAMRRGFGKRPVFIREGGSNPIVPILEEVLGAPTVMFGIGSPEENPHAPNEHLDLSNFQRGIIAAAHLYAEFGRAFCGSLSATGTLPA
jgi:acetylornithine deacetylase/succinyl-diaminopimelate desuccinylase-like protein